MRSITFLSFVLVTTSPALAEPLVLAVDESRSSANVELCMTLLSTACDTGTTPISGTVTVAFDCPPTPGEIILHDFTFELVNDVHLDLNFGNGMFNSVGRDVVVRYAEPGGPRPPEPLTDGGFAVSDVTSGATGYLDYATTGLVCTLFTLVGYPCADTIDLTTLTLEPLDMAGSVVISGDAADLALDITVSGPIDPDLGTLDIVGTIHAAGAMPPPCCPGDLTGDDWVDLDDHARFANCLAGPSALTAGPCQCADFDEDVDVDLADFAEFQVLFQGP